MKMSLAGILCIDVLVIIVNQNIPSCRTQRITTPQRKEAIHLNRSLLARENPDQVRAVTQVVIRIRTMGIQMVDAEIAVHRRIECSLRRIESQESALIEALFFEYSTF